MIKLSYENAILLGGKIRLSGFSENCALPYSVYKNAKGYHTSFKKSFNKTIATSQK